jgi:hypothetical protein
LRISAEQLYIRAGIISPEDGVGGSVELAVSSTAHQRQKRHCGRLLSFLALNEDRDLDARGADRPAAQQDQPKPKQNRSKEHKATAKFDIKTVQDQAIKAAVGATDRRRVVRNGVVDLRSSSPRCRRT